jgi:hypothetical protein
MPHPVSIYLLAMACGDIASARIGARAPRCVYITTDVGASWSPADAPGAAGPRSSVWAEPCVLPAAAAEFDGPTEKYIAAGARACERCMPALFQRVLFRVASITRIVAACSGSACWPLPLGRLRHSRDAALLPVGWCDYHPRECVFGSNRCWRRDGKRLPDIRHALPACRRQVTDGCRCTRDRALVDGFVCCTRVVWNGECVRVFCPAIWLCFGLAQVLVDCRQPRDECIMVRVLVERGPHDVPPGVVACG